MVLKIHSYVLKRVQRQTTIQYIERWDLEVHIAFCQRRNKIRFVYAILRYIILFIQIYFFSFFHTKVYLCITWKPYIIKIWLTNWQIPNACASECATLSRWEILWFSFLHIGELDLKRGAWNDEAIHWFDIFSVDTFFLISKDNFTLGYDSGRSLRNYYSPMCDFAPVFVKMEKCRE